VLVSYLALKNVHVTCVVFSYVLFVVRGVWMISDPAMLAQRWVKIVPHFVDTVLLVSAVALAVSIAQYPFAVSWLTAKVIGLVVYIALGMLALRRGTRNKRVRVAAWIAAQAVFFYIVAVAVLKRPLLFY